MSPRRFTARDRAIADAVTPLVADALTLHRQLAACGRRIPAARHDTGPLLGMFAEQMAASADLLAECVRGVGGRLGTREVDGTGAAGAAAVAPAAPVAPAAAPRTAGATTAAFRRLLADEDEVAARLRRAIATCDANTDERTASCLEEVLDEVERQRSVLRRLVPGPTP
jgi:DNA-binding ferritin-like protein